MTQLATGPASQSRSIAALPGPRGLPVFGNVLALQPKKLHLILERWAERYGPAYAIRIFNRRVVVVTDRSAIAVALRRRPAVFRRMAVMQDVLKEMGVDGVFSAEGETWRVQRRSVAQALDASHVRTFFPTLRSVTERLKRRWDAAAEARTPIDVLSDLSLYTVDVTTNFAFGYDMNTLEHDGDVMQGHLSRIFPMINRRINLPVPYWRYFKLPVDRAFDRSVSYVRRRVGEMIDATRGRLALERDGDVRPKNFIEAMLAEEADGTARLSPDELYANAMTILVAGEDTTASALAWSLHLIASHPRVQARLREEADLVLAGDDVLSDLSDIGRLVYHDAVLSESLRLKPVAPLLFLEANVATEVADVRVPAGTPVFLVTRPHAVNRQDATATDFVPERWLDGSGRRGGDFAFGAGPRLCPGRNLALVELTVALSMIVKNFALSSPPNRADVYEEFSFAMVPRNLRLQIGKRNSSRR
jgi:cytochrome P450